MPDDMNRIHEQVMKVYGDQIAAYARGSTELEKSAISVAAPAIAALTMPEEYAAIVLTSRMDNELRRIIERALHRQGDPEALLFDFNMAFGTFSAKAAAAYSFGLMTEKMHDAITNCRKIRNAYAHADDPDDARKSKSYMKCKEKLISLDPDHTRRSIEEFRRLRADCTGVIELTLACSDVTALMLSICENLGSAAFYSLGAKTERFRVIPAFFGFNDADALMDTPALKEEPVGTSPETAPASDDTDQLRQQN